MRLRARFLLALAAGAFPALATAATPALTLRSGAVLEGPQHTLKSGFVAGVAAEWPHPVGALGAALEWARDSRRSGTAEVLHLGVFARWELRERGVRPFVEAGAGVSRVNWAGGAGPTEPSESRTGAGGWIGAGAALPMAEGLLGRVDLRYHALVVDAPGPFARGGDLGDYFSLAGSVAFAR